MAKEKKIVCECCKCENDNDKIKVTCTNCENKNDEVIICDDCLQKNDNEIHLKNCKCGNKEIDDIYINCTKYEEDLD